MLYTCMLKCGHVQVHFERSHFRAIQEEAVSIFFVWEGELQMLRRFDLQQLVSLFATQPPHSRAFSLSISSCSSPPCSCPPPPLWHLNSMCERATTSGIQLCSRMCTSYSPVLGHRVREQRHKHGNTRSPKLGGGGLKIGGDTSMQNNGGGGHAEAPPRKCSKSVPVSQSRRRRSTYALTLTAKRHRQSERARERERTCLHADARVCAQIAPMLFI